MSLLKAAYCGAMSGYNGFTNAFAKEVFEFQDTSDISMIDGADLVFLQPQDSPLSITELQRLKESKSFVILWSGDARNETPAHYIEYAKYVDITCFSNMKDVRHMQSLGFKSEFLQIGYDPEIYTPVGGKVDCPDIVFMGNNFGHFPLSGLRQTVVAYLKDIYGSSFGVYGIGWDNANGNFMGNQLGEAEIYRSAKIGINLSHYDYELYTSDRLFRMLGSGVCVLSHDYKAIRQDFVSNEVWTWRSLGELKSTINILLAEDKLRKEISQNGHQLALNNHTFTSMAKNIIQLYNDNR